MTTGSFAILLVNLVKGISTVQVKYLGQTCILLIATLAASRGGHGGKLDTPEFSNFFNFNL
jgi:hypothetical protein